jgi:hypothetical protein
MALRKVDQQATELLAIFSPGDWRPNDDGVVPCCLQGVDTRI